VGTLSRGRGSSRIEESLAKEHPEKLQALIKAWFEEAEKNKVLPLDDRGAVAILTTPRPTDEPDRERYIYYPETNAVPESVAANVRGRSFKILADIEIVDPGCSGVIFAHGSRFGGHALFIKDKKLHYVYNFLGFKPAQKFVSPELQPANARSGWNSSARSQANTVSLSATQSSTSTAKSLRKGRCERKWESSRWPATVSVSAMTAPMP
jgi:hypothetical protein